MTIEFNCPKGALKEFEIDYVKGKLIEFYNQHKEISRAEVSFKETPMAFGQKCVCEIAITIYGDSFLMHCDAESYLHAAMEAIKKLQQKADELKQKQKDPPEQLLSTVKV